MPDSAAQGSILGRVLGIVVNTPNTQEVIDFYAPLGFQTVSNESGPKLMQISDGALLLYLNSETQTEAIRGRELLFAHTDLVDLGAILNSKGIGFDAIVHPVFGSCLCLADPGGQVIRVMQVEHLPEPTIKSMVDVVAGKFGEYSIPVLSYSDSFAYWEKLGFQSIMQNTAPYNWGIVTDGVFPVGLHETNESDPTVYAHFKQPAITYFAPNMQERILAFKAKGFEFVSIIPVDDTLPEGNGIAIAPDGTRVFLFHWGDC